MVGRTHRRSLGSLGRHLYCARPGAIGKLLSESVCGSGRTGDGWRLLRSVVGVDLQAHGHHFGFSRLAILAQDVNDADFFASPNSSAPTS
jgi:hypothetical protein